MKYNTPTLIYLACATCSMYIVNTSSASNGKAYQAQVINEYPTYLNRKIVDRKVIYYKIDPIKNLRVNQIGEMSEKGRGSEKQLPFRLMSAKLGGRGGHIRKK